MVWKFRVNSYAKKYSHPNAQSRENMEKIWGSNNLVFQWKYEDLHMKYSILKGEGKNKSSGRTTRVPKYKPFPAFIAPSTYKALLK